MAHEGPPCYRHVVDQTVWGRGTVDTMSSCPRVHLIVEPHLTPCCYDPWNVLIWWNRVGYYLHCRYITQLVSLLRLCSYTTNSYLEKTSHIVKSDVFNYATDVFSRCRCVKFEMSSFWKKNKEWIAYIDYSIRISGADTMQEFTCCCVTDIFINCFFLFIYFF